MPVEVLALETLLGHHGGRHFASEPHLRIQVLPIKQPSKGLFEFHGELLLLCLKGEVSVRTAARSVDLDERDQLLLIDGEPFAVDTRGSAEAIVQFVWTPGPNHCETCQRRGGDDAAVDSPDD